MRFKIVISTILPEIRYTQLALYNLKAYALKYSKYKRQLDIDLYEIEADRHQYVLGASYPVLSKKSLINHAVKILKGGYCIVGFSCFMWNIELVLQLCKILKEIRPSVVLILGGPEASADPENLLSENNSVDMVIRDEGEATFTEVVDCVLSQNNDFSAIKGLIYRQKGHILKNAYRSPIDLKNIPSPYLTGLINLNKNMSYALETSRGCPFHCAYCTYSIRGYHQLRFFPIKKVLNEIKMVLSTKQPIKIRIMDDNFNINVLRTTQIIKQIVKLHHNEDIKVFLNSSMWKIDDVLVKLLKKCDIVCSVGVQSINEHVLQMINRKNNRMVLESNLQKFDKYKLKYELSFILGLPGESYQHIKQSLNWAFQYNPKEINLFPLMIFKGTYLSENAIKLGLYSYGKPFYIIRKNKTLSKALIKKGIALKESIGLLYNKGLLKNTMRFFSSELKLPFVNIVGELGDILQRSHKKKTDLQLQKYLIKSFMIRHPHIGAKEKLKKLMQTDFIYFSVNNN